MRMKKIVLAALLSFSSMSYAAKPCLEYEKWYFTQDELCCNYFDSFYIHLGENVWEKTRTIHRDAGGMYYLESGESKEWRCPYCMMFFKVGKPCENEQCPSSYAKITVSGG